MDSIYKNKEAVENLYLWANQIVIDHINIDTMLMMTEQSMDAIEIAYEEGDINLIEYEEAKEALEATYDELLEGEGEYIEEILNSYMYLN